MFDGKRGAVQLAALAVAAVPLVLGKLLPKGLGNFTIPLIILSVAVVWVFGIPTVFALLKYNWLFPVVIIIGLLALIRR